MLVIDSENGVLDRTSTSDPELAELLLMWRLVFQGQSETAHQHLQASSTDSVSHSLESLILLSYGGIRPSKLHFPPFTVASNPKVQAQRALLWSLKSLLDHRVSLALRWVRLSLTLCETGVLSRLVAAFCYREEALSLPNSQRVRSLYLLECARTVLPPADSVSPSLQPFRLREDGALKVIEGSSDGEAQLLESLAWAKKQDFEYERWLTARVIRRLGFEKLLSTGVDPRQVSPPEATHEKLGRSEPCLEPSHTPSRFRRFLGHCQGFARAGCPLEMLRLFHWALKDLFWHLETEVGNSPQHPATRFSENLSADLVARGTAHCGFSRTSPGDEALFFGLTRLARITLKAAEYQSELKGVILEQRRSQQIWEEAFMSTPLGVAVLRDRGVVEQANPKFRDLVADNLKELTRQVPPRIDGTFRREVQSSQGLRVLLTATSLDGTKKLLILTVLEDADKEVLLNRLAQRQKRLQTKLKETIISPMEQLARFDKVSAKRLQTLLTAVGEHLSVLRHPLFETEDLSLGFERLMVQLAPHWRVKLSGDWSKVRRLVVLKAGWLVDCILDLATRESTLLKATALPEGGLRLTVLWWEHLDPHKLKSPTFLLEQLGCHLSLEDDRLLCEIPNRGTF